MSKLHFQVNVRLPKSDVEIAAEQSRETEEPGRTQDRSKDRCLRQVNCLPNLAWTKVVWRCRLRVCVPIGLQMPVFMTCENFCQAKKAGLVGCRPVCWAVLNGSSPLCLPCHRNKTVGTAIQKGHFVGTASSLILLDLMVCHPGGTLYVPKVKQLCAYNYIWDEDRQATMSKRARS